MSITLEPINQQQFAPQATPQASELYERAESLFRKIGANIASEIMADTEAKANALLGKLSALATPQHVCINIKINSEPMKTLKKQAHPELAKTLSFLKAGLTPMLVGDSGCGKTFLAEQASEALSLPFEHLCFTSGVSESWLFGRQLPCGFIEGGFSKAYRNGGVFLADELDAGDPNMILSMNTALANGHMHNPMSGENIKRHKDFHFIAACNSIGKGGNSLYVGRNRLDAATLKRFTIIKVDYDKKVENSLLPNKAYADGLRAVRKLIKKKGTNELVTYREFEKLHILTAVLENSLDDALETIFGDFTEELRKEAKECFNVLIQNA